MTSRCCIWVCCLWFGVLGFGCSDGETAAKAKADAAIADTLDTEDSVTPPDAGSEIVDSATPGTDASAPVDEDAGLDATLRTTPDGCVANCAQSDGTPKVCGGNGCGSVCGFCKTGYLCKPDGSECIELCKPKCDGKKCGDNGCGGNCGTCQDKFHCGIDFLCHEDACVGSCASKQCGDDGCGISCGDCPQGDLCESTGQCKPGPCKGIPNEGSCAGDILKTCVGSGASATKLNTDCGATAGKTCGWDPLKNVNACIEKPPCVPNCKTLDGKTTKVCGDNGCGKPCGTCTSGWTCKITTCEPTVGAECGSSWPPAGKCSGNTLQYCSTGSPPKIVELDCSEVPGWKCQYTGSKYDCVSP